MKKILFPLLQSNKGGNILSTVSICNKIDKNKFNSFVLMISKKNEYKYNIKNIKLDKNVKINKLYIKNNNKFFFLFLLYINLIKFFYLNRFDIIHTNDGILNFHFSIICFFFRKKHVLHLRNTDDSKRNYFSFYFSKKIICISNFIKKNVPIYFKKKAIVLYNYVDFFNKNIKLQKKHNKFLNQNKKKFFLFFISNIHKRKNPYLFLDIIHRLNKIDNKYIGLMFFQSDIVELKKLKHFIKTKKIENNIYIFRNYPVHYWVKFAERINKKVLIAPSENEPLGRNIIEAIFKNIFVFANNSGGHKEIINKSNGILFNAYSKNLIGLIIKKFSEINKKSHENKAKVKEKFIKKFQNKNYIKSIEKIYSML